MHTPKKKKVCSKDHGHWCTLSHFFPFPYFYGMCALPLQLQTMVNEYEIQGETQRNEVNSPVVQDPIMIFIIRNFQLEHIKK